MAGFDFDLAIARSSQLRRRAWPSKLCGMPVISDLRFANSDLDLWVLVKVRVGFNSSAVSGPLRAPRSK